MNRSSQTNMEIEFIEDTKYRAVFDLKGATHTFANALKNELWSDKDIKISAYNVEHPLIGIPRVIVETKSGNAKKAIVKAVDRLKKQNTSFKTAFKKLK